MPGRSEGEKACRQVLAWVESHLQGMMPESRLELLRCRLEGELSSLVGDGETVELPW
jgi:hypothetical protein